MSVKRDWEKYSSKTTVEEKLEIAIAENNILRTKNNELNSKNYKLELELMNEKSVKSRIVVDNSKVELLEKEIERLREYEFMCNGLCK